jgi:5-bromo-4-chloroindolyl phosphate hydrolysis protein
MDKQLSYPIHQELNMNTQNLTKKELQLIIDALTWADQTMRDFDKAMDKKADAMEILRQKLEELN